MIPKAIIEWFLNFVNVIIRGIRLLFSPHFYVDFFTSIISIWQLLKDGGFMISTRYFHDAKKKNILIYSRFQADGDILHMLPTSISNSQLESICTLHQKKLKQKLDSIWFAPRFLLLLVAGFISACYNWSLLIQAITTIKNTLT